jgi:cytochrome c551
MRIEPNIVCTALGLILLAGGIAAQTAMAADPIQTTKPLCVKPTNDMAVEGRRAFMRMNCYSCHGATGHGGAMGPSLVGVEAGDVNEAVLNGGGEGMPSFKNNLCAKDIPNLTAYLQLLGTGTEPTFVNWWEPGPGLPKI